MNFDTFRREKVNSAFPFPAFLNLYQYTKEGLAGGGPAAAGAADGRPPAYYDYELAGVVVHTGTTDSGHYYSYIKERWSMPIDAPASTGAAAADADAATDAAAAAAASVAPTSGTDSGDVAAAACRWFEFNDSEVSEFSASRIEAECFGGSTITHDFHTATQRLHTEETVNPKSAYMLVYRRSHPLGEVRAVDGRVAGGCVNVDGRSADVQIRVDCMCADV